MSPSRLPFEQEANQDNRRESGDKKYGPRRKKAFIPKPEPKDNLLQEEDRTANKQRQTRLQCPPPNRPCEGDAVVHILVQFRRLLK